MNPPTPTAPPARPGIADLLLESAAEAGCTELEKIETLARAALGRGASAVEALLDAGLVDEARFLERLALRLGLPWVADPDAPADRSLHDRFPATLALRHRILPQRFADDSVSVLTFDPFQAAPRQAAAQLLQKTVLWGIASRRSILEALKRGYGVGAEHFDRILAASNPEDRLADLRQEVNRVDESDENASILQFVNQILREAIRERATDIHIEPLGDDLRIRYRIDGSLQEVSVPPDVKLLQASLVSRLKIMAHLDIAERRLPQDGRINLELEGRPIDVRVATIPSVAGESVSLRLLAQDRFELAMLGLDEAASSAVRELLALPNGILLVTGPTGCGKSTTLYTFLKTLNTRNRRIVTIEDPVEYKLPGVIQIAVKPEIDLTFANGLRSILRGDPNVIMVGEMRDFETAEIAIRGALTGHLVFSTLHTNDAIGGITRLMDMGIEPFLIASAVRAFLAQRLVRVLCPECSTPTVHSAEYLRGIGFPPEWADRIRRANGCAACRGSGYSGRAAILEICRITPAMQEHISERRTPAQLRATAVEEGMVPLRRAGFAKVAEGVTTLEEVLHATAVESAATAATARA